METASSSKTLGVTTSSASTTHKSRGGASGGSRDSSQQDFSSRPPHVFEIVTDSLTYLVGEDPTYGQDSNIVVSPESGMGLEQARHWEHAIRQALMPVTPQSSMDNAAGVCRAITCFI